MLTNGLVCVCVCVTVRCSYCGSVASFLQVSIPHPSPHRCSFRVCPLNQPSLASNTTTHTDCAVQSRGTSMREQGEGTP